MKINRIFVSRYKNLVDCEIRPNGIHAITGCNGSGKSNFLEVLHFIAGILVAGDESRDAILTRGACPAGGTWFPFVSKASEAKPFRFEIECEIKVDNVFWLANYSIELEKPEIGDSPYVQKGTGIISSEIVRIKERGKPGKMRLLLKRSVDTGVQVRPELDSRNKFSFKAKSNMSALVALEIREADDFIIKHPVLSIFLRVLKSSDLVKLDPNQILEDANPSGVGSFNLMPADVISHFPLYDYMQRIKLEENDWEQYMFWVKQLCDIDKISLSLKQEVEGQEAAKTEPKKYIFISRQEQFLFPNELSTGNSVLLSLVTALFSFLRHESVIIFEEPETFIHPKAIIDLIKLLREISEENTVLFSTHSPVALNSLNIDEVSLMEPLGHGFFTMVAVSEISEAVETLKRGYISFGDLLQSNYTTE